MSSVIQQCKNVLGTRLTAQWKITLPTKKTHLHWGTFLKLKKENNFMSIKSAFDQVSTSQSFCPKGTDPFNVSDLEMVRKMSELRRRGQWNRPSWEGLLQGWKLSIAHPDKKGHKYKWEGGPHTHSAEIRYNVPVFLRSATTQSLHHLSLPKKCFCLFRLVLFPRVHAFLLRGGLFRFLFTGFDFCYNPIPQAHSVVQPESQGCQATHSHSRYKPE